MANLISRVYRTKPSDLRLYKRLDSEGDQIAAACSYQESLFDYNNTTNSHSDLRKPFALGLSVRSRYAAAAEHVRHTITIDVMTETVTIAALMAFDTYPVRDDDPEWLRQNCDAATYALTLDELPRGGWTSQGYAYECAAMITVDAHSPEATSAVKNREAGQS